MEESLTDKFNRDPYSLDKEERLVIAHFKSLENDGFLPNGWALYICGWDPSTTNFKDFEGSQEKPKITFDLPERFKK